MFIMDKKQRQADGPLCNSSRPQETAIQSPSHHPIIPTISPQSQSQPQPQPQRRWHSPRRHTSTSLLILLVLTCFLTLTTAAATIHISEEMVETPIDPAHEDLATALARLARSGQILVDQSPPPKPKQAGPQPQDWTLATVADDLRRRQVGEDPPKETSSTKEKESATATKGSVTSTVERPSSTGTLASSSTSSIVAAETEGLAQLPTVFDNGFSSSVTANCAGFLNAMLANATFKACLPFSLLLENSNSFFQASKSITRITQTLDATCAANSTLCTSVLSSFARNITSESACSSDITSNNPLAIQAQAGLLAYAPLYAASCLRNPSTSSYCYADAITNASSPTNSYIYFLPLNMSLPAGSMPTCNECLKSTMGVFGAQSGSGALRTTYSDAAKQVNVMCGPSFVNTTLASPSSFGIPSIGVPSHTGFFALLVVLISWLL